MPNIHKPVFEEGERPAGFRARRARIGYELGSELIGCSLWEVPPGEAAYPYHYHYADEELLMLSAGVASGTPAVNDNSRTRRAASLSGRGRATGPQPSQDRGLPAISSHIRPTSWCPPTEQSEWGSASALRGLRAFFTRAHVDYWDREQPPGG